MAHRSDVLLLIEFDDFHAASIELLLQINVVGLSRAVEIGLKSAFPLFCPLPGNVGIKQGAPVVNRQYDTTTIITHSGQAALGIDVDTVLLTTNLDPVTLPLQGERHA